MTEVGGRIFTVYAFVPFECTMWIHHMYLKKKKNTATSHFWVYTHEMWYQGSKQICVHSAALFTTAKVEATQASINRWMDMQNVSDAYNGLLVHL